MTCIVNTKLSSNRDTPRLWLEGAKMAREGFYPGMRYDLKLEQGKMQILPNDDGKYTVSTRKRNGSEFPLVDVTRKDLADIFAGVELLRVLIRNKSIIVTPHHQQLRVKEREERFLNKLRNGESLAVCSMFHGGGVLDSAIHEGLQDVGVASHVAVAVEIDGDYLDSSLVNNSQLWDKSSIVVEAPIQSVNLKSGSDFSVDISIAGIPCTGASRAGRTKGKLAHAESHPEAGAMFYSVLKFFEQQNPVIGIIENVPEYSHTSSMEVIRSVLDTLGYTLQERVLEGNEFGALENRKRLCVVAISKGLADYFDLAAVMPIRKKEESISQILEDISPDSDRFKTYSYLSAKEQRDRADGKGFSRQMLLGSEGSCNTLNRTYHKGQSTGVFVVHPTNPDLSRLLTPIEHCRAKGIPESLIAGLSDTKAHEVLGQAVIYPAFQAVARSLGRSMWNMAGVVTVQVEVVDTTENFIGGDDIHSGVAIVSTTTGEVSASPADAKRERDVFVLDDAISVVSNDVGPELDQFNFDTLPVGFSEQGRPRLNHNQLSLLGL